MLENYFCCRFQALIYCYVISMEEAVADKRDIKRHKKRLTIRFGIDEANRMAFTEDISATGMFIKTPNVCVPNSKIKVEFVVEENTVQIEARVMWAKKVPQNMFHLVKKSGMGIRFLKFHAGEQSFINYFEGIAPNSN